MITRYQQILDLAKEGGGKTPAEVAEALGVSRQSVYQAHYRHGGGQPWPGKPARKEVNVAQLVQMRAAGMSVRSIAARVGVSHGTVHRLLQGAKG